MSVCSQLFFAPQYMVSIFSLSPNGEEEEEEGTEWPGLGNSYLGPLLAVLAQPGGPARDPHFFKKEKKIYTMDTAEIERQKKARH